MILAPEAGSLNAQKWHVLLLHNLTAVMEFLDRLERCGCQLREVRVIGESDFRVRWYS